MTCERFITGGQLRHHSGQGRTLMVSVLPCPITVSEGGDVEICGDFADLDTAIHTACRAFVHPVVRRTEVGVTGGRRPGKQSSET